MYRFIFSGSIDGISPRVQAKSGIPGFLRGISLTRGVTLLEPYHRPNNTDFEQGLGFEVQG